MAVAGVAEPGAGFALVVSKHTISVSSSGSRSSSSKSGSMTGGKRPFGALGTLYAFSLSTDTVSVGSVLFISGAGEMT